MINYRPTEHFLNVNSKTKILFIFSLLLNLNIYAQNATSGGTVGHNESICPGEQPSTIENLNPASGGGTSPIEYLWMTTTNPALSVSNWNIASGTNNQATYTPPNLGTTTYFIRCARRQGFSEYAVESNIITISVLPNPTAQINENPGGISIGTTFNFSAANSSSSSYSWDFDGDGIEDCNSQNCSYNFSTTGTFNVTLTVDNGSCSFSDNVTVNVNPTTNSILDPCTCDDPLNFSLNGDYFVHDFIMINSSPGETWQIINFSSGGIFNNSGTALPVGTTVQEITNSPGEYYLSFWFKSGEGYNVYLHNGTDLLNSGTTDPCSCVNPLPVELVSFSANLDEKNNQVNLNWSTANEINNSHFELQRSLDGNRFDYLQVIPGNGNSSIFHSYDYVDKNPIPGINYYRLKQVDFDGTQSYSDIVSVKVSSESIITSVIPNPIHEKAVVRFGDPLPQYAKLQILSSAGQIMATYSVEGLTSQEINMEGFEKGIYFVRIKNSEKREKAFFKILKF